jgi:hypothetical protein
MISTAVFRSARVVAPGGRDPDRDDRRPDPDRARLDVPIIYLSRDAGVPAGIAAFVLVGLAARSVSGRIRDAVLWAGWLISLPWLGH